MEDLIAGVALMAALVIAALVWSMCSSAKHADNYFCESCGCLTEIHKDGKCTRQGCRCGR